MTERYDPEILMRHVDGELAAAESARIEADSRADPALAARLSALRGSADLARAAFPVTADPRDDALFHLIAASGGDRPVVLKRAWGDRLKAVAGQIFSPAAGLAWGGLATAAFVAGVLVAPQFGGDRFAIGADGRIADRGLVRVLDTRLAADGVDGQGRAVGLTFREADGRWCRTFRAAGPDVAGLACREAPGAWSLVALAPTERRASEVRTAGAETPQLVLDAVDARAAGGTVDAVQERAAREAGWR